MSGSVFINPFEPPKTAGYCKLEDVVLIRVFNEDDGIVIDGLAKNGDYTEDAHKYPTWDEAIAQVPEFCKALGLDPTLPVQIQAH